MRMNEYLKSGIVLSAICIILALVLGGVNLLTSPIIEENDRLATQKALREVYPDADDFEAITLAEHSTLPEGVIEAYRANDGGYVIKVNATGYMSDMIIIFGVSAELKIVGAKCLSSNETNHAEKTYGDRLIGATLDEIDGVDAVTKPTAPLTVKGYKTAAKNAVLAAGILKDADNG